MSLDVNSSGKSRQRQGDGDDEDKKTHAPSGSNPGTKLTQFLMILSPIPSSGS
jgi:hypothetical protein